jgi:hypothetical protein
MSKANRLSHIIEVYLSGDLDLDTAAAELLHAFVDRGWRFSLIESDCDPAYRERMRALAQRVDDMPFHPRAAARGRVFVDPPIIIR